MKRKLIEDMPGYVNKEDSLLISGWVHTIRNKGKLSFLEVKDRSSPIQVVINNPEGNKLDIKRYDIVSFVGKASASNVKSGIPGVEFQASAYTIISSPQEELPIPITSKAQINLDQALDNRVVSVRNQKNNLLFQVQAMIADSFEDYLRSEGFTRIFTPKIVPQVAEGGANMFKIDYFGNDAYLTQSPQLYKQIMVGSGLERVMEIGPVFRAEKHQTSRHINEYTSMDLEMGFINSFEDLMLLEESMIKYIVQNINNSYSSGINDLFGVEITVPDSIPRFTLDEALSIIKDKYGHKSKNDGDIDPKGEQLITAYVQEEFGSDFVFLTHFPSRKRPFYTMPSKDDSSLTESFDLIYRGLEITTGGQRIHNYDQLKRNLDVFNMSEQGLEGYLDAFKYGMPPHGGMGIGLERVTARMLNLNNVKEATLFPRDKKRLKP